MGDDSPKFGSCPSCGQTVNAEPGQQTPPHRPPDDQKLCPGGTAQ